MPAPAARVLAASMVPVAVLLEVPMATLGFCPCLGRSPVG